MNVLGDPIDEAGPIEAETSFAYSSTSTNALKNKLQMKNY